MEKLILRRTAPTKPEQEEARLRLNMIVPNLFIAANLALGDNPDGVVGLAIVTKHADGSGMVGATLRAAEFLRDLETAVWQEEQEA